MTTKKTIRKVTVVLTGAALLTVATGVVLAHKEKHTPAQLAAFEAEFMRQVRIGDLLWHGDAATQKELGVNLSNTGAACAMCHPDTADAHPQSYPKFQEQMGQFATFRDMVNWCIEKPNQGERIDPDGDAMKAIEAYAYWANRGSDLEPGRH
jgi:thiosulfate dehydrogenase